MSAENRTYQHVRASKKCALGYALARTIVSFADRLGSRECPGAPPGYDQLYFGRAYKTYFGSPKNYEDAQAVCLTEGAMLPIFPSQEDYNGAKIVTGLGCRKTGDILYKKTLGMY